MSAKILGLLETALYVREPNVAADFYRRVFGFPTLLDSERLVALEITGKQVLLLFRAGGTSEPFDTGRGLIPGHGGSGPDHLAFAIAPHEVDDWCRKLTESGIEIESRVAWETGSISLYFRDPDQNLVELMTPGFWWKG